MATTPISRNVLEFKNNMYGFLNANIAVMRMHLVLLWELPTKKKCEEWCLD